MRTAMICLSVLLSICSGKKQVPPEVEHEPEVAAPPDEQEPEPILQVVLDTAVGQVGHLEGEIRVWALAGSTPPGSTTTVGIEPPETLIALPHTGAAARIGPVLSVSLPSSSSRPILISVPVDPENLPGGLTVSNIHAARVDGDGWSRVDSMLQQTPGEKPSITMAIRSSGRYGLLADASRITVSTSSHAASLLVLVPYILGPHAGVEPVTHGVDDEQEPERLFVLDTVVATLAVQGTSYQLLETKDRNKDGSSRLLAVRRKGGIFVSNARTVAEVLVAQAVREKLAGMDREALATMLEQNGAHLEARTSDVATLERVVSVVGLAMEKSLNVPVDEATADETLEGFGEILGDEQTSRELTDDLLTLELVRTRMILENLALDLRDLDPSTDDGDALLDLGSRLGWALGRIDGIGSALAPPDETVMLPPWHDTVAISKVLDPEKKKTKKPSTEVDADSDLGISPTDAQLQALATALSAADKGAQASASMMWASLDLLGPISTLAGKAAGAQLVSMPDVLASAAEVAAREPVMAPPPETEITKHSFKNGKLSVVASGTDEDGKIKGYRWWFDSKGDPHVIKGKGKFTASLSGLRSGSHDLFVAAIDDDDQRDPTADRISFYVRRTVSVSTKALNIQFDAHPWNVNSEHKRSVKLFVRRLEGPVQECADDNYRWGIDGGGKVTVGFGFSKDKTANVAHSTSVIKDTFKNKALSSCIRKALKKPRMRYNQEYKPAAQVTLTFHMKPSILFFDAESLAGTPGPDVMGAALYLKCTTKAIKKAEIWCDAAVRALPGPWDAENQLIEAGLREPEVPEGEEPENEPEADEPAEADDEESSDDEVADDPEPIQEGEIVEEALTLEEMENLVIPHPEFDAIEIHGSCIEQNVSIFIENCMLHLTKKRLWCADSCLKKAKSCSKKCNSSEDWGEDPFMCKEACWTDDGFPCAENCAVKKTPFESKAGAAEW